MELHLTEDEKELILKALAALAAKEIMDNNTEIDNYKPYSIQWYNGEEGIIYDCKELAKKINVR